MALEFRAICLLAVLSAAGAVASLTAAAGRGDIRDFRVGASAAELPQKGYLGFACGANGGKPGPKIEGWAAFARCPADAEGLHEVAFRYDDSEVIYDDLEGTAIAGHPVLISLLFDDAGVVEAIRVLTDPFARPYHKRRAHMLTRKVKARFGLKGWHCVNEAPAPDESEVGGLLIKERCEKDLGDRSIDLYTRFFRAMGENGSRIVNSTRFEIRRHRPAS